MTDANPAWRIAPFGAEAAAPLAALHGRCFTEAWSAGSIAAFLSTPGSVALLATAGAGRATPAGLALARTAAGEAELVSLGVVPHHRRRGCGRALLRGVAEWAAARAATALFLEVAVENQAARALYEDVGFAAVARRPAYYERTGACAGDALVMRRALDPSDVRN